MAVFYINTEEFDKLQKAMRDFPGDAVEGINEVLHKEGSQLIQDSIQKLIPRSNAKPWKGKAPPAASSKALRDKKENLSVTVTTAKTYQYLYFPDDGTNTRRHAGNQQFFFRGAEAVQNEVIERCINRLTENFNK